MNTLGELFAGKLFLLDDFDDELFIHHLMNFVMLHLLSKVVTVPRNLHVNKAANRPEYINPQILHNCYLKLP